MLIAAWQNGSMLASNSAITLRQARLVSGWATADL